MKIADKTNVQRKKKDWQLHLMILPGLLFILIFKYMPLGGITIAFKEFLPGKGIWGSPWVGLENFEYMLALPDTKRVMWNTLFIAAAKILINFPVPIIISILLNEVKNHRFKRSVQTIIYLPYFISWVILAGIIQDLFAKEGLINQFLGIFGAEPVFFLGNKYAFLGVLIGTDVWKNFGYNTVVYLAAITGIDETLYEAAKIDGANGWKTFWKITVPLLKPTIIMTFIMSINGTLQLFDESVNLTKGGPANTTITMSHYVYNTCFINVPNFGYAAAMSFIIFIMVAILAFINLKVGDTRD